MNKLLILLLFLLPTLSFSQKEAAIWYFGQYAGLDFNSGVPVVLTDGQIDTYEGCATICDFTGNLLFYTDGVTVWAKNHSIMPNGTRLLGNTSSTQSAIIIPRPNNPNIYYIFTVDDNPTGLSSNGINYSTIDLTLNGGLGDVIASEKNIPVIAPAFEKITATKHANGNSYWVTTFIKDRFYSWLVDASGVNLTPVISNASNSSSSIGYIKTTPDGSKIACANYGISKSLRLYDFNTATGIVSNELQLTLDDSDDIPYGIEFSPKSTKLYVETDQNNALGRIPPSKIIQYDLLSANISNSRVLIHTSTQNTRGALQLAIDGKIYRARSVSIGRDQIGTPYLGVINDPEANGTACNYVHDAIDVSNGDSFRNVVEGLPPFISSFFVEPTITANEVCFGTSTAFMLNSSITPSSISWNFGDPASGVNNTSTDLNPTHLFSTAGIFTITAAVTIGSNTTNLSIDVTIYDAPVVNSPVSLVQCDDDIDGFVAFNLEEANSLISANYLTETINYYTDSLAAVNSDTAFLITNPTAFSNATASTVWASVENTTLCKSIAEVNLEVATTNIPDDLMLNFYECDTLNGTATFDFSTATNQVLNALLPQTGFVITYYENITDALAEQNAINPTNYTNTTPNTQQIVVRADDINNGCFGLGYHVTLNIETLPQFDLAATISFCENETIKTISVENPLETYTYLWQDAMGNSVGTTQSININTEGLYTVTATSSSGNSCATSKTIQLLFNPAPAVNSPINLVQCDDDTDGFVTFNLEEANSLISANYLTETINYYTDSLAAVNSDTAFLITNPTAFSNATASTVWVSVENTTFCKSIAEVNLEVATTDIPDDLMLNFYECDTLNGTATFDFSTATNQVLIALLPQTGFVITYYENITDALAEQNAINPTNYTNTTPNAQQIVVRADDINNGCFGLGYHVTLNVDTLPQFDLAATISFCENETIKTISVENPLETYTYVWQNAMGNSVGTTQSININTEGLYTVTVTNSSGNSCAISKTIQVLFNPAPAVNSPINLVQCDDDTDGFVTFNLEEANSLISANYLTETINYYTDSLAAVNSDTAFLITNPTAFSNATASTVWASVENTTLCKSIAEVNLEVATTDIPDDLMLNFYECDTLNGTATFDFSTATNQVLNALLPQTGFVITYYENITDALAEQNAINPTNYTNTTPNIQQIVVRADDINNGCFGLGYHVTLNVETLPQFDLATNVALCFSSSNTTISIENPQGNYSYNWINELGTFLGDTPEINVSEEGNYFVTATAINNAICTQTKSIQVTAQPYTILPDFNEDNIQINDNSTNNTITVSTLNLPVSNYQYALDDGDFQTNNVFENVASGKHVVKIRDLENCLEAAVEISVISIPNFFTPNNDGYNDTWHVTGIEFQPTSNVYIFDRFGKLIVILDPLGPGWNGVYKGNPLPSTDYWYRVELEDGRVLKGHFSLVRQ
ncbi:T9SS type B sorting domain-containing protein [Lutibacter holmesii]|uniref:T9SS type B sorting domain-containing protein n=1 Tax=Lutibacter holmesii TaxID=1137985 RepID=A0ABW3WLE5_9FLAO